MPQFEVRLFLNNRALSVRIGAWSASAAAQAAVQMYPGATVSLVRQIS